MSTILAVLMVLALVLTEHLRRKKKRVPVFSRQYIHPGHTWMRMTEDGDVMVGVDQFAAGLIGGITSLTLPRYLKKVHQGEPSFTINQNGRTVTFVSPVSGRVVEKNEMVLNNPSLALVSPLRDGWMFKVHPSNLANETKNLFAGKWAETWGELSRMHLVRFFSLSPVPVSQDGGKIIEDLALHCSEAEWSALKRDLFLDTTQDSPTIRRHEQNVRPEVLQ